MDKVAIICGKCRGRIFESAHHGAQYIDLTCLRCGWSRDVPSDVWAGANLGNVRDILKKVINFEY
jgi:predicted nucleic-acid-binding Zn-ribbon protein